MEKASTTSGNTGARDPISQVGSVESCKVEPRNSPIHGIGLFAKCDIHAGEWVIDYVGERIEKAESLRRCERNNQFIFGLNERFDIDGNVPWNLARFINHSCAPNCEARPCAGVIQIVASRDIRPGEEITFNYGYDLEDYREHPCNCGVTGCAGYIVAEEFFEHVRQKGRLAEEASYRRK